MPVKHRKRIVLASCVRLTLIRYLSIGGAGLQAELLRATKERIDHLDTPKLAALLKIFAEQPCAPSLLGRRVSGNIATTLSFRACSAPHPAFAEPTIGYVVSKANRNDLVSARSGDIRRRCRVPEATLETNSVEIIRPFGGRLHSSTEGMPGEGRQIVDLIRPRLRDRSRPDHQKRFNYFSARGALPNK
jgi:hypothetical protein